MDDAKSKDANGKPIKRKQAVLRTRKSIGTGKGSGSDDDFKPINAAALKRKPTEKKEVPQKSKDMEDVKVRAAESSVPKRKTAQKKIVDDDDDDDMYMEVPPLPPPPKTKPNTGKKAPAPESNSDSDVEVIEKVQPKRKAAVAAKPVAIESDSESEEKLFKGKGKAKPPKRKRWGEKTSLALMVLC
jgi:DNA topoisomerase-2